MFLQSGGTLVRKGITFTGSWASESSPYRGGSILGGPRWSTYAEIYRTQLWVSVMVNKLAKAQARLPLPVYQRGEDNGRRQVREHPYARLLRNPSSKHDPFTFYAWTSSILDVFGEMAWGKIRDGGGRPVELVLLHPAALSSKLVDGERVWEFRNGAVLVEGIPDHDIVFFHTFNPDDPSRGLSPLEPLRATLENEDAARRATSSFWTNGARPGVALVHPGQLSPGAQDRLKVQWMNLAGGADRTGTTVVLEEGMKPEILTLSAEEAQYIETRKLNREEVAAAFDIPPPVVHILDRATFSNITEQMRSMYRDTMGPRLGSFESVLETELRGSIRPGSSQPDFGDDVYAEFLLDEVLRGDFEARADAVQKMIFSGQRTPNEARAYDNLPPLPGGNQLYINTTMAPVPPERTPREQAIEMIVGMITNAPSLVQNPGLSTLAEQIIAVIEDKPAPPVPAPAALAPGGEAVPPVPRGIPEPVARKVLGRLSRPASPAEVEVRQLVDGLDDATAPVLLALIRAQIKGEDMPALRARIAAMTTKEKP